MKRMMQSRTKNNEGRLLQNLTVLRQSLFTRTTGGRAAHLSVAVITGERKERVSPGSKERNKRWNFI